MGVKYVYDKALGKWINEEIRESVLMIDFTSEWPEEEAEIYCCGSCGDDFNLEEGKLFKDGFDFISFSCSRCFERE